MRIKLLALLCGVVVLTSGCATPRKHMATMDDINKIQKELDTMKETLEAKEGDLQYLRDEVNKNKYPEQPLVEKTYDRKTDRTDNYGPIVIESKTPARSVKRTVATKTKSPTGQYDPKKVQSALKNSGFYKGSIDGKVGNLTKKAIMEFQRANSLKVDGIVGKQTWAKLSKWEDLK
jgi:Putative peptidoglycan binding domain